MSSAMRLQTWATETTRESDPPQRRGTSLPGGPPQLTMSMRHDLGKRRVVDGNDEVSEVKGGDWLPYRAPLRLRRRKAIERRDFDGEWLAGWRGKTQERLDPAWRRTMKARAAAGQMRAAALV